MKNIPEIRIKGFEGEWKEKQLKDVCEVNPTTSVPDRFEYVDLESVVGTTMVKHRTEEKATAPSRAQRHAKYNDIFFQTVRPYQKNNYLFQKKEDNYVFSTGYAQLRANINPEYLFIILQSTSFVNQVLLNCTGSNYPAINPSALSNIDINITESDAEQQSLGSFFSSFDRLLSDHHRRLENLRRVKKSMLQKMFPQQGQTVPEIRFKGFSGEWKEIKLGDVGKTISGVGFPNKEQGGKHGIPFYKVSDMNNKGNETMMINANNYVTKQQIEKYHWKVCEDVPAIFFAKVGAAIFFDRKRLVTTPCLFDNNTMVYCLDKEFWDATFCLKLFEQIKLSSLSQVGSLPSFNGTAVESISVLIPSKAEQHLIGSFFTSLDNLINDEVNYIDQLTRVKSTLLQKMFV